VNRNLSFIFRAAEAEGHTRLQSLDRTRTWVESVAPDESIQSHSPKPDPAWLRRRMTPEPFLNEPQ
jgi:hypothetical protein